MAEAGHLFTAGRYADARQAARVALAEHERDMGPRHPDIATIRRFIARCNLLEGRLGEAERLLRDVLWRRPESCGKEKWRILPVGEVHDQPAALAGGHRRNAPWTKVSR
ncbi:MAG: tetratricopeptide repeat protein, partial [Candidatus Rokubacteria bacterium]|nr:tetratricopeptide repeat protein [Candidatus Rokubacteria bacterium]